MSNFDDEMLNCFLMDKKEEEARMLDEFKKSTEKKIRKRFKRLVKKLEGLEGERFRNLLDLLFHPEKRTPIVDTNPHLLGVKEF